MTKVSAQVTMKFETFIRAFLILLIVGCFVFFGVSFAMSEKIEYDKCLNDCMAVQGFDSWSACHTYCYYQDEYKVQAPCK